MLKFSQTVNNSQSKFSTSNPNVALDIVEVKGVIPSANAITFVNGSNITETAVVACNYISSMLGLETALFPEVGSKVLVLRSQNNAPSGTSINFMVGMLTDNYYYTDINQSLTAGAEKSRAFGELKCIGKQKLVDASFPKSMATYPVNFVNGEYTLTEKTGVGLQLRMHMAALKGSDLACVETYLLDDFVRIVSKNFEHITGFGNYRIVNRNNAISVVWEGSSYEHETLGMKSLKDKKPFETGNKENNLKFDDKDANKMFYQDGRWRFSQYIGKLGNIFNLYISDPHNNIEQAGDSESNQENGYTSSRFRFHINEDGSVLFQSVSDIIFEKTICIPTPIKLSSSDAKRLEELKIDTENRLEAYQLWQPGKNEDWFSISYKIHDYGKWFSNYYTVASFLGAGYHIAEESKTKDPDKYAESEQLKSSQSNIDSQYEAQIHSYATIRMLKDGSITLYDAYGSCIQMAAGDINISAAKNINLISGKNINLKSGDDITALAKDSVEITAAQEGILLKSKLWFEQMCTKGQMILRSLYNKNDDELYNSNKEFAQRIDRNGKSNGIVISSYGGTSYSDISIKSDVYYNDSNTFMCRSFQTFFNIADGAGSFVINRVMGFKDGVLKVFSRMKGMLISAMNFEQSIKRHRNVKGIDVGNLVADGNSDSSAGQFNFDDYIIYEGGENSDILSENFSIKSAMKNASNVYTQYKTAKQYGTINMEKENKLFQSITEQYISNNMDRFVSGNSDESVYTKIPQSEIVSDLPQQSYDDKRYPYPGDVKIYSYQPVVKILNAKCTDTPTAETGKNNSFNINSAKGLDIYAYSPDNKKDLKLI